MPDKAIDVIDEAASKVNLNNNELIELVKLQQELKETQDAKDKAAAEDDYKKAADLKSSGNTAAIKNFWKLRKRR